MIKTNSAVLYKNDFAIVTGESVQGKFPIKFRTVKATQTKSAVFGTQNVRAKDIVLLSEGPVSSIENVLEYADKNVIPVDSNYSIEITNNELFTSVKEVYELLSSDSETQNNSIDFLELCSLIKSNFVPDDVWGIFCTLKRTVFFNQNLSSMLEGKLVFIPRKLDEIDSLVKKADEKNRESELREAFLGRLKNNSLELPGDAKFMTDVEALALGKTDKSRTMHDAQMKETPERAHKLLLDTKIWSITRNPYPLRWGLSTQSADIKLISPPDEERVKVEEISYAIDNAWSADPDDAIGFDGKYLWVHIADPASTVMPDSKIDIAARGRGSTLYIPEGASRMLCEDSIEDYALGLKEDSKALSFRLLLDSSGSIEECEVLRTSVKVKRLTYSQADEMKDTPELKPLFEIAERNLARRMKAGAVQIDIPEVHIAIDPETKKVSIERAVMYKSGDMVKEMMLLAGEGAARYAFANKLAFPFVSQDAPEIPSDIPEGLAGQFKLRRCMRKRSVNVTPSMHSGLGLGMYSQVTSPLRRYSDLIAHMQLRALITGKIPLDKDTMLMRVSEGDAASSAAHQAERKSNLHWTLVYLLQNPQWSGEAICVDNGGRTPQFFIPSLGLETFLTPACDVALNETITLKVNAINIPELTVEFIQILENK